MDSKTAFTPAMEMEGEAPPPAYTASASASQSLNTSTGRQEKSDIKHDASPAPNYSAQIRSQLESFSSTLSAAREQRGMANEAREIQALSVISNAVELFLLSFSRAGQPRGSLVLIPNRAVMLNAEPVDADYEDTHVYRSVMRLDCENLDEAAATNIADAIRPAPELPKRSEASEEVEKPAKKKSSWWKRSTGYVSEPASRVEPVEAMDRVALDIKAEEVVFRAENQFGILEINRGWGIVVNIALQAASTS